MHTELRVHDSKIQPESHSSAPFWILIFDIYHSIDFFSSPSFSFSDSGACAWLAEASLPWDTFYSILHLSPRLNNVPACSHGLSSDWHFLLLTGPAGDLTCHSRTRTSGAGFRWISNPSGTRVHANCLTLWSVSLLLNTSGAEKVHPHRFRIGGRKQSHFTFSTEALLCFKLILSYFSIRNQQYIKHACL